MKKKRKDRENVNLWRGEEREGRNEKIEEIEECR